MGSGLGVCICSRNKRNHHCQLAATRRYVPVPSSVVLPEACTSNQSPPMACSLLATFSPSKGPAAHTNFGLEICWERGKRCSIAHQPSVHRSNALNTSYMHLHASLPPHQVHIQHILAFFRTIICRSPSPFSPLYRLADKHMSVPRRTFAPVGKSE